MADSIASFAGKKVPAEVYEAALVENRELNNKIKQLAAEIHKQTQTINNLRREKESLKDVEQDLHNSVNAYGDQSALVQKLEKEVNTLTRQNTTLNKHVETLLSELHENTANSAGLLANLQEVQLSVRNAEVHEAVAKNALLRNQQQAQICIAESESNAFRRGIADGQMFAGHLDKCQAAGAQTFLETRQVVPNLRPSSKSE